MSEIDPNLIKERLVELREQASKTAEANNWFAALDILLVGLRDLIQELEQHDEDSFHDPDCATLCDGNTERCLGDHSCSTCAGEADVEASSH